MKCSIKRKGFTLDILEDSIESPREYFSDSNIGTIICFNQKYKNLADNSELNDLSLKEWLNKYQDEIIVALPLYVYDHSGISISTSSFNDKWDSGFLGFIYCTEKSAKKENLCRDDKSTIVGMLEDEVIEYDNWLQGIPEYCRFEITNQNDELVEAEGVFKHTSDKEMIEEMKERSEHKYDFLFDCVLEEESSM